MTEAPLLSVIVPVYKAEAALRSCVESILAQGVEALEVILVEDGSPDGSGALCDALAREDGRVLALHRPNGGASAARNTGLAAARGRYLTFVDADDRLLPGLYAEALPLLEKEGLAWYGFGVRQASGAGAGAFPAGLYPGFGPLKAQLERLTITTGLVALLYNKIYRASLVSALRFDEGLAINEDLLFNLQALRGSGPFRLTDTPYYFYEDTAAGSLSRRLRTDLLDAEARTRRAYQSFLAGAGLGPAEQRRLLYARQADVARLQFTLLTGQKGRLPLGRRRALLAQCLAAPGVRPLLLKGLEGDNSLLSSPYRYCIRHVLPGLLALYCTVKEPFLP